MGLFSSKKRKKTTCPETLPAPRQPPRPSTAPHPTSTSTSSHRPRAQHHQPPQSSSQQQSPRPQAQSQFRLDDPQQHPLQYAQHNPMASQPAGYLPAPPGWTPTPAQPPPPYNAHQHQNQRPCQPIVVNQYYLHPTPPTPTAKTAVAKKSTGTLNKLGGSVAYLTSDVVGDVIPQIYGESLTAWQTYGTQMVNQTAAVVDQISSRLNHVMTMIDGEPVAGNEVDLFMLRPPAGTGGPNVNPRPPLAKNKGDRRDREDRGDRGERRDRDRGDKDKDRYNTKGETSAVAAAVVSGSYFSKVDMYTNSKLPRDLPRLKL